MKNKFFISISFITIISFTARSQSYVTGNSAITVGYGFPNLYKSLLKNSVKNSNNYNNQYYSSTSQVQYKVKGYGPLFLKYEYALTSLIGIGASVGYWDTKFTETQTYQDYIYDSNTGNYSYIDYKDISDYRFTSISAGARLNFHFGTTEKLDPYAGIAGGYTKMIYSYSYNSNNPNKQFAPSSSYDGIPVYFAITAGLRYYFTENIGAYTEIGLDKWSIIQGGLAIKF